MFETPQSVDLLLLEAQNDSLYTKLIEQINKDFNLSNEAIDLPISLVPEQLKLQMQHKIHQLITHKFTEYLNLLYIIDVPEEAVKKLDGSDLISLSEQVVFLILKREWMKIWFRNNYQ